MTLVALPVAWMMAAGLASPSAPPADRASLEEWWRWLEEYKSQL